MERKDIEKKAIEELNSEGLLTGTKITEKGKREAESVIKSDRNFQNKVFKSFWRILQDCFYEDSPKEFTLKILNLKKLLKKLDIDLYEKLK